MSLTTVPNVTLAIYRSGNGPPQPPDVPSVAATLTPAYATARNKVSSMGSADRWTHVATMASTVDIRDDYNAGVIGPSADKVYLLNTLKAAQVGFVVRFVEVVYRGTTYEVKRVYLDRKTPIWPSNDI